MRNFQNNNRNSALVGLVILIVGVVFLLPTIGIYLPRWIFGWNSFILMIGIYLGAKRNFTGNGWLVMVLIGTFFTLKAIPGFDFDISKYAIGVGFVILGAFIIIRPKKKLNKEKFKNGFNSTQNPVGSDAYSTNTADSTMNSNDIIDVMAIFGGSNQTVYSKNFNGGDITAVFGGADINFVQADFLDSIHLDVTAIFGGIKLIVPQDWAIKSNVTAIFGSVEDKRAQALPLGLPTKTLVLDGSAFFGGIEIKSY